MIYIIYKIVTWPRVIRIAEKYLVKSFRTYNVHAQNIKKGVVYIFFKVILCVVVGYNIICNTVYSISYQTGYIPIHKIRHTSSVLCDLGI